ncbi:hypothetical protein BSZ22_12670 [Bradyrhizobium canariense]|nr:hypothetical protein BSZ22_12670 [Bradyrhizobium canariense]OSI79574.1 hypothetical protein BSZ23_14360 [Bradyrhizobium canariense]
MGEQHAGNRSRTGVRSMGVLKAVQNDTPSDVLLSISELEITGEASSGISNHGRQSDKQSSPTACFLATIAV